MPLFPLFLGTILIRIEESDMCFVEYVVFCTDTEEVITNVYVSAELTDLDRSSADRNKQ